MPDTRPTITVLCGSTRFGLAFQEANLRLTLAGHIVLSIGCDMRSDHELLRDLTDERQEEIKRGLDELHKRKIDLADEVYVLNVGGYIGDSTRSEIAYAEALGRPVRYLEDDYAEQDRERADITTAMWPLQVEGILRRDEEPDDDCGHPLTPGRPHEEPSVVDYDMKTQEPTP